MWILGYQNHSSAFMPLDFVPPKRQNENFTKVSMYLEYAKNYRKSELALIVL
jgi:hypothetical protein